MDTIKKAAVIGGDERSAVCAEHLAKSGIECALFGLEKCNFSSSCTKAASIFDAVCESDILILPLPVMSDSANVFSPFASEKILLSDIIENMPQKSILFAGNPQKCFYSALEAAKTTNEVVNYAKSDLFAILGSVPTVEGAVMEAIFATGKTISASKILVTGFGRVGKQLSLLLKSMNADVTVTARKITDMAFIEACGMKTEKTGNIAEIQDKFDIIFNTVPVMLFDKKILFSLKGKPVIIELASKPYGVGFENTKKARFCTPFFDFRLLIILRRDCLSRQQ